MLYDLYCDCCGITMGRTDKAPYHGGPTILCRSCGEIQREMDDMEFVEDPVGERNAAERYGIDRP